MAKLWGWKTIVGGLIFSAGQAMQALPPPADSVGQILMGIGALLGAVGIAHKQAKILAAAQGAAKKTE